MKKRILLLSCVLTIMLGISGVLLRDWRQNATRCQTPFLTTVPSPMPKMVSGILARIEWTRYWNRSMPSWWEYNPNFPHPDQNYSYSVKEIAVQDDNIWTISYFFNGIQRYNRVTGEIDIYNSIDGEEVEWARHLLVTQNGEVWVAASLDTSYALALFDTATNAFNIVEGDNPFSNWKGHRPPKWGANL